ncbi:horsetail movement protein Hrs1/Mcp6 [Schizosaccharomyces pombe]|uniref:Meiotic coiled-coil protein 6 n=1 Tax=Schizosaccharomyces pombe (strain 972 / ATCC 24843) TaxID=284812 RepID=MCP6_SCHPO|nr:horsetail movement protein Hrs1/Mcp6 [Schizosaccharomyces pombe]Q10336.1 RecName: Full=Meiotic coiled-coil protein 6; AltName: Full=Horsetail movement protein hrs1; AltName: Full=Meiotically up-regulated gene 3 protein [Schizosaccharomyces pombe 972h-]BAD42848.1 meiotic coiled-coil protein 6 [Schizosaccharomyces pombe]CAB46669.1 horsetail movement protein Hrs1/Mcp6 [Schizosaccharomyces pombe]|eukprot:NP_595174.1 horsetail movement protein Hrs1/Mcp6 [Schizosaccharomyces pombe]
MEYQEEASLASAEDSTFIASSPVQSVSEMKSIKQKSFQYFDDYEKNVSDKTIQFQKLQMTAKEIIDAFERDSTQRTLQIESLESKIGEQERDLNNEKLASETLREKTQLLEKENGALKVENGYLYEKSRKLEEEMAHLKKKCNVYKSKFEESSLRCKSLYSSNTKLKDSMETMKRRMETETKEMNKIKPKNDSESDRFKRNSQSLSQQSPLLDVHSPDNSNHRTMLNINNSSPIKPKKIFKPNEVKNRISRLQKTFADLENQHHSFQQICQTLRKRLENDSSTTKQRLSKLEEIIRNRAPPSYSFSLNCSHTYQPVSCVEPVNHDLS